MSDELQSEYDFDYSEAEPNRFAGHPSISERQTDLLALIREAFGGVELGNGVGLRESLAIDDYATDAQRLVVRDTDETHDWRKLIDDPDLQRLEFIGGLAFMDAASVRFHLPAYLSAAVAYATEDGFKMPENWLWLLWAENDFNVEKLTLLTTQQKRCVGVVALYLREIGGWDDPENEQRIRARWLSE